MERFTGKVVIVTGGGSGLGRAVAVRLGQEGGRVLVADINDEGAAETAAHSAGPQPHEGLVEPAGVDTEETR